MALVKAAEKISQLDDEDLDSMLRLYGGGDVRLCMGLHDLQPYQPLPSKPRFELLVV